MIELYLDIARNNLIHSYKIMVNATSIKIYQLYLVRNMYVLYKKYKVAKDLADNYNKKM